MKLTAFDPGAAREARRVLEYNPYHGKDGRFTGKSGAASTSVYSGKPSLGNRKDAIRADMAYRKQPGTQSPLLRQDERAPMSFRAAGHRHASRLFAEARRSGNKADREQAVKAAQSASMGTHIRGPEHRERVEQDPRRHTDGKRVSRGKPPASWPKDIPTNEFATEKAADRRQRVRSQRGLGGARGISQQEVAADFRLQAKNGPREKRAGNIAAARYWLNSAAYSRKLAADAKAGKTR